MNFTARLGLWDLTTGEQRGSWGVDKNSWALSGAVTAGQRPGDFMIEAASKIGEELSRVHTAGPAATETQLPNLTAPVACRR